MESTEKLYLSRLDHLRFLAAYLVLCWHFVHRKFVDPGYVPSFFPLSLLEEGHTGVSLFMVLSGFIFQYINAGKEIIYGRFVRNRLLRIAPLFILWNLYHVYVGGFDPLKAVVNGLLLIDPRQTPGVAWTIVVEFQFYLLFPFLHKWIERKRGVKNMLGLLLMLFLIRSLAYGETHTAQEISYWTIFGRLDQFLIGMLAAHLYRRVKINGVMAFTAVGAGLLGSMALMHLFNRMGGFYAEASGRSTNPIWLVFPDAEALCYATLLLGYIALPVALLPRSVDRLLARCGEFSYSAYWCHVSLVVLLHALLQKAGIVLSGFPQALIVCTFVAVPVVFAFSGLTYHLVEKPFLLMRQKHTV